MTLVKVIAARELDKDVFFLENRRTIDTVSDITLRIVSSMLIQRTGWYLHPSERQTNKSFDDIQPDHVD